MARISVVHSSGGYQITISGQLAARDLKQLERACAQALVHKLVPLELNVKNMRGVDDAAREYLERLRKRGARLKDGRELSTRADRGRT
jgi:hypothetical protein